MARYIDADKVIAAVKGRFSMPVDNLIVEVIRGIPTISPDDVRSVVHCRECKWCHAGYCEKYDDLIPWGCANKPWEDWPCADGAKMEVSEDA